MPHTVITFALPEPVLDILRSAGTVSGPEDWEKQLGRADALVTLLTVRVDEELLSRSPVLKVVANAVVGTDNIDLTACKSRGVVVTNTPDVLTDASADLAIALLLATVRRLPQAEKSLRAGAFRGWRFWDYIGGNITGSTLGIFGMGRIGEAVARRARPFGMRVIYHNRTRLSPEREADIGATWVDWETLLTTSDILSLNAPSTPSTRGLFDAQALRRMRRGSYLINTARGDLVDEAALAEVLRSGHLAGAGLDVYQREPEVHPDLLDLDNVVLLPHIGSATPASREAMATLAARNVHAVLSGNDPLTPV